jgi:hypothetical protein
MDVEVLEWNFGVGKTGNDISIDMKIQVAIRQKK